MSNNSRPSGRPRDEATGPAILSAARRLVLEKGYEHVSIGEIIALAGVSRQSLYRRWPTKADLVLEAFFEAAVSPPEIHPDRPVSEAVQDFLTRLFEQLNRDGGAITSLIAASLTDPDFARGFRAGFVEPRERMVTVALEEAVRRGELPSTLDVKLAATVIHGAFWYRLLNRQSLDHHFANGLVAMVFQPALPTER